MTLADRLIDLNRWYEELPDDRRIFVYPGVLLVAALVNARWTGSPFGWLFFAALAALVVIRRSYVSGYLKSEALADGPAAKPAPAARAFVPPPAPVPPAAKPAPAPVAPPVAAQPIARPAPQPVAAQPVARPAPQPAAAPPPAPPPVAAQPAARPVPPPAAAPVMPSTPTVDGPRPVPAAAATIAKKTPAPPPRKNDGRSGRRKPGDKHP